MSRPSSPLRTNAGSRARRGRRQPSASPPKSTPTSLRFRSACASTKPRYCSLLPERVPRLRGMRGMPQELEARPAAGLLGWLSVRGRSFIQWRRSFAHVKATHENLWAARPTWLAFDRRMKDGRGNVGIWHATCPVRAGEYEAIYPLALRAHCIHGISPRWRLRVTSTSSAIPGIALDGLPGRDFRFDEAREQLEGLLPADAAGFGRYGVRQPLLLDRELRSAGNGAKPVGRQHLAGEARVVEAVASDELLVRHHLAVASAEAVTLSGAEIDEAHAVAPAHAQVELVHFGHKTVRGIPFDNRGRFGERLPEPLARRTKHAGLGQGVGHGGFSHADRAVSTVTIHCTPKRSVTMPKQGDQNVGPIGISMRPPSDSITRASPINKLACMILSSNPEGSRPSGIGWGLSENRIFISTLASRALS